MEGKMNYLVDTNVWLELLLDQENTNIAKEFFSKIPSANLCITDFSLHSIGVILDRFGKMSLFFDFVNDLFVKGNVSCLGIAPLENIELSRMISEHNLDFDDSYQVIVSQKYSIHFVTFDKDFKKRGIKAISPKEALLMYKKAKKEI